MFFEIYGGGGAKPCLILLALPFFKTLFSDIIREWIFVTAVE